MTGHFKTCTLIVNISRLELNIRLSNCPHHSLNFNNNDIANIGPNQWKQISATLIPFFFFLQISGMQMDLFQLIWIVLCNFTTYIDDFTFLSLSTYIDIYILWYISNVSVNHSVLFFLSKFGGCQFLQPRFLSVAGLPVSRNADPACGLGKCGNWLCCCVWVCSFCPLC